MSDVLHLVLSEVRKDFAFQVRAASVTPMIEATYSQERFWPGKVTVIDYYDRAKVVITGKRDGYGMRSATFRLRGYPKYKQPPAWVIDMLRQAGYDGEIETLQE